MKKAPMTLDKLAGLVTVQSANLEKLAGVVTKQGASLEKIASLMVDGFENLNEKVDGLTQDIVEIKRDVAEMKTDLHAHAKAIDKDAVTLMNHETRIKRLEHAR